MTLTFAADKHMKTSVVVLLMLAPVVVVAQQPSGTPPENPITTSFKGTTMYFQRNLAQAFDSIPERLFGYKPTPAQLTIGYIAQHVASDNYFFCNNFGTMKASLTAEDTATADSIKAKWPKEKLVSKLKESFKFCEDAFAQVDDAKLADQVTVTFGSQSRQRTRANFLIGHVADMADHYSQISNYMRLNKMLPPTALPRPKAAN